MPKYIVPAIDPDSGIDSFDGSGYVSLPVWEETVLEKDLQALQGSYRDAITGEVPADDETIGYILDSMYFDIGVLGRFMEERWAALYESSGYTRTAVELTADLS